MIIRPTAEIVADFPDDVIYDEKGEILEAGGRGFAEAIAEILRGLGYEVSTPEHQPEHGWDFMVRSRPKKVWMQITDLGTEYILTSDYRPTIRAFFSQEQMYAPLLKRLHAALKENPRFKTVKWYDRYDAAGRAADQPVDD